MKKFDLPLVAPEKAPLEQDVVLVVLVKEARKPAVAKDPAALAAKVGAQPAAANAPVDLR